MFRITKICLMFFLTCNFLGYSQDFSAQWEAHFSYFNIVDLTQGNGKLFAASENAVFSYDPSTEELITITTINGLTGDDISEIYFSEVYQLLVIGYENGLLQIYDESDDSVLSVVEILDKQTIPPNEKRINHFEEFNEFIYISSDFGVSVYNLERLEFDDTYFIGFSGEQILVEKTAIFQDRIYASCQDNNGLKRANITSENLINFQEWNFFIGGNFRAVDGTQEKLYALRNDNRVYEVLTTGSNQLTTYPQTPVDFRQSNNEMAITLKDQLDIYSINFVLQEQIIKDDYVDIGDSTDFVATEIIGDFVYVATNDSGVLSFNKNDLSTFNTILPEGPISNSAFSITALQNGVWVSYGDYTFTFNPGPFKREGLSHLKEDQWINIPKTEVFGAVNLNSIAVNPFDPNQVFVSSFQNGILEINNDVSTILYNQTNSGLESVINPNNPNFISVRTSASTFDRNGLLWSMTGRIQRPLKSYDPSTNTWQSFDFGSILPNPLTSELGYGAIAIDDAGNKWIGGLRLGFIGFNPETNTLRNFLGEDQNLPSPLVNALVVDQRNQLWVGTSKGLRILFDLNGFFTDPNPQFSSIIILEDGLAQELLFQQFITDIEVDGSNNKWIATADVGLFYVSDDGQETIFHFTNNNSPIPSNNVVDVSIDETDGTVYIATDRGLVSFKSGSSKPVESLENAFIFPNPVRPGYDAVGKKITIKDISENVNIKITDIEGNLVAEAESNTNLRNRGYNLEVDGGTAFWNGKSLSGTNVASGVYLIMLTDLDNLETKVLKLMLVR